MTLGNPAWLAAFGVSIGVLICACIFTQHEWSSRAAALARENSRLQLAQLSHEFDAVAKQLADRARDLSKSEQIVQLLQDNSAAAQDRLELYAVPWRDVDALVVTAGTQSVRFSAAIAADRLQEQPADNHLLRYLDTLTAIGVPSEAASFIDKSWVVARPIATHGPGT